MKSPDFKSILGAVLVGIIMFGGFSVYESQKIQEIQSAAPDEEIKPPPQILLWCVNHKIIVAFGFSCILLGLASYGSPKQMEAPMPIQQPIPPARI